MSQGKRDETLTALHAADPDQTSTGGRAVAGLGDQTLTGGGTAPDTTLTHVARTGTGALVDKVEWEIGDVIDGKYEVTAVLGRGGMGVVYKVRHLDWNIDMAVKMPLARLVADEAAKARFIREAQTWVDLGLHPNIVQCWYVRELGGVPRIFVDYMAGGTLKDWIHDGKVKPGEWDKILDLVIQACDGLTYAHAKGVVHRDIKPANLLLTEDGRLCVTDFGVAKLTGMVEVADGPASNVVQANGQTLTDSELGTPEYGAPEQWNDAQHVDHRADVYALGVILFELCCGQRPFDDGSHSEPAHIIIGRHLSWRPPNPSKINPRLPRALKSAILQCLAKSREDRPASVQSLRDVLATTYRKLTGKAYPRPVAPALALQAGSLSNQALSMLHLGQPERALERFKAALVEDPFHVGSTYNQATTLWHAGVITDEDAVERLVVLSDAEPRNPEPWCMLGFIHLERLDRDKAVSCFEEALRRAPDAELESLIRLARERANTHEDWAGEVCTIKAHECAVSGLAVADSAGVVLSGAVNGVLVLSDIRSGRKIASWSGHTNVSAAAITPDGRFALTAGDEGAIKLWALPRGECIAVIERSPKDKGRCAVALRADGLEALLAVSDEGGVERVALPSGTTLQHIREASIIGCGGPLVASRSGKTTDISDGFSGKLLGRLPTEASLLAASADRRLAIAFGRGQLLQMWGLSDGKLHWSRPAHDIAVAAGHFTADGRLFGVGGTMGVLQIWDSETGYCVRSFLRHADWVVGVHLSPTGECALSASHDGTVRVWRTSGLHAGIPSTLQAEPWLSRVGSLEELRTEAATFARNVASARQAIAEEHLPKGLELATVARSMPGRGLCPEALQLWRDVSLRQPRQRLLVTPPSTFDDTHGLLGWSLCLSPRGDRAFVGHMGGPVTCCDLSTGRAEALRSKNDGSAQELAISRDGSVLLIADGSRITVWDDSAQSIVREWASGAKTTAITVDGVGRLALSGGSDGLATLWDVQTGQCLRVLEGHGDEISDVAITADGAWAATGSADGSVRLWDVSTGRCERIFAARAGRVAAVAFGQRACSVAAGYQSGELRLWDVGDNWPRWVSRTLGSVVRRVVFSSDWRWLFAVIGTGGGISVIEGESGRVDRTLPLSGDASYVAIRPDGLQLVATGRDRRLHLWELVWELAPTEARDWDEAVLPYLEEFLYCRTPYLASAPPTAPSLEVLGQESASGTLYVRVGTGHTSCRREFSDCLKTVLVGGTDGDVPFGTTALCRIEHQEGAWAMVALAPSVEDRWGERVSAGKRRPLESPRQTYRFGEVPVFIEIRQVGRRLAPLYQDEATPQLVREGKPVWSEDDLRELIETLGHAGFGFLRPDGVRRKLRQLAREARSIPSFHGAVASPRTGTSLQNLGVDRVSMKKRPWWKFR